MGSKGSAIIKLVVWTLVAVVLGAALMGMLAGKDFGVFNIGGISLGAGYFYDDADSYNVGDREYDVDLITDIDISWLAGNVKIVVWENSSVKVTETRVGDDEDDYMRSRVVGSTLIVKFKNSGFNLINNTLSKDLTVYIPSRFAENMNRLLLDGASARINIEDSENRLFFNTLDVDTASGEVNVNCKGISVVNIDTASGDIYLAGEFGEVNVDAASADVVIKGKVDKFELDSASGSVTVDGEVGAADIGVVSGEVFIKTHLEIPSRLEIEAVSGRAELSLPDTESGFVAELDSTSGKMTCNGTRSDYYSYGGGRAVYDFESVSGNVIINVRK